jgi:hypothetical protein
LRFFNAYQIKAPQKEPVAQRVMSAWVKSGLMQCSKLGSLLDHLVSTADEGVGDVDAERLGGLQV